MNKPTLTYYWPGKCKLRLANVFLNQGKLGCSSITSIECSVHSRGQSSKPVNKPTLTYYWPGKCKLRLANVFLKEGKLGRSSITSIECSEHNKHSQITSQKLTNYYLQSSLMLIYIR